MARLRCAPAFSCLTEALLLSGTLLVLLAVSASHTAFTAALHSAGRLEATVRAEGAPRRASALWDWSCREGARSEDPDSLSWVQAMGRIWSG